MASDTVKLAKWFVSVILKRPWTRADFGGVHRKQAKNILALGYTFEEVQGCAFAMYRNPDQFTGWNPDWRLQYLSTLMKGEPPYVEQFLAVPDPPPIYEIRAYDEWVRRYGKRAIEADKWDGCYIVVGDPYRIDEDELAMLLDEESVQRSLLMKADYMSRRGEFRRGQAGRDKKYKDME